APNAQGHNQLTIETMRDRFRLFRRKSGIFYLFDSWPEVRFAEKRAVTWDEHLKILDREPNQEKAAFYDLAWHIGAAQTDLANLRAEDIDWGDCVIAFRRAKTGTPSLIRFDKHVADALKKLPATGYLFPTL